MILFISLLFASATSSRHNNDTPDGEFMLKMYEKLENSCQDDDQYLYKQLHSINRALSSNAEISSATVQEFVDFIDRRKEKKTIKELLMKILRKKGLDKLTGKKIANIQKSCKTCKSQCSKTQKLIKRKK